MDYKEQRVFINFCFILGKTATKTCDTLKVAFGEERMSISQIFECFSIKTGMTLVEDTGRLGHRFSKLRQLTNMSTHRCSAASAGRRAVKTS
jgi:hypothetical protein